MTPLRVVRRSSTTDTAHSLIRALVHSRLDYCNSTLAGLPQCQLNKLQSILRVSARLVLLLHTWTGQRLQSDACSAPLASFLTKNQIQTVQYCLQMSPRCRTSIPVQVLCPAFLSSGSFSVTFCSCRRSSHSTYQNCYNRRSGFIRSGSCCLEQSSDGP